MDWNAATAAAAHVGVDAARPHLFWMKLRDKGSPSLGVFCCFSGWSADVCRLKSTGRDLAVDSLPATLPDRLLYFRMMVHKWQIHKCVYLTLRHWFTYCFLLCSRGIWVKSYVDRGIKHIPLTKMDVIKSFLNEHIWPDFCHKWLFFPSTGESDLLPKTQ